MNLKQPLWKSHSNPNGVATPRLRTTGQEKARNSYNSVLGGKKKAQYEAWFQNRQKIWNKHLSKEEIQITITDLKMSAYNDPLANKQVVFPASKEGIKSWHRISTLGNAREKWNRVSTQDLFTGAHSNMAYTAQRCEHLPKDRHSVCVYLALKQREVLTRVFTMSEPWEHYDKKSNSSFFLT